MKASSVVGYFFDDHIGLILEEANKFEIAIGAVIDYDRPRGNVLFFKEMFELTGSYSPITVHRLAVIIQTSKGVAHGLGFKTTAIAPFIIGRIRKLTPTTDQRLIIIGSRRAYIGRCTSPVIV